MIVVQDAKKRYRDFELDGKDSTTLTGKDKESMVMLVAFGIVLLFVFILKKVIDVETLTAIQKAFEQISGTGVCLPVIGAVGLSLIISYLCSLRGMNKKEL